MVDDVVDRDGDGRIVTLDHHAKGITDEEDVDACLFRKPGKWEIVDRDHAQSRTVLASPNVVRRQFGALGLMTCLNRHRHAPI
jgi:hypothetical protein